MMESSKAGICQTELRNARGDIHLLAEMNMELPEAAARLDDADMAYFMTTRT